MAAITNLLSFEIQSKVFFVLRGCYAWHGAPFNVPFDGHAENQRKNKTLYIYTYIYAYRFCVDFLRPSDIKLFLIGAIFEL